jgi:hypothetical protein
MADDQEHETKPGKAWLIDRVAARRAARAQGIEDLFEASRTGAELKLLADRHLAMLIEEHLMPQLSMTNSAYLLLDEVVMRLDPSKRV